MTPFQYRSTASNDVNDHAASLSRWDQQYDQVSPGRFAGRLEELWLGPLQVFRERTELAVLQRGTPGPGTLTLATPVGDADAGWFCGQALQRGAAFGLAGGEFELATRGRFDIVAASVDREVLDRWSQQVDGRPFVARLAHNGLVDSAAEPGAALCELQLAALAIGRDSPQALAQAPLRERLLHSLCDLLIARLGRPQPAGGPGEMTAATRQRVVREARRHMAAHAEQPISVPELCEALHVSRRTLQYAFQDVLQMSPVSYLRALGLLAPVALRGRLPAPVRRAAVADAARRAWADPAALNRRLAESG